MNAWQQRLITYIQKLDAGQSFCDGRRLVLQELAAMEQDYAASKTDSSGATSSANQQSDIVSQPLPIEELIKLFRELFYGRQDVFAVRWDNEKAGTHGYAPKCKNEWDRNLCGKTQCIKGACKKCSYRENQKITNSVIQQHFIGSGRNALTIGVYPLLSNEMCRFLAIDFDKGNWKDEMLAAKKVYQEYGIESYMERSRSGKGGHLWIFFREEIEARIARQLGLKVLETAMARRGGTKFDSFDRLFPNQDQMPKGGYGNLIALPLQRQAVEKQNAVFIDEQFQMYPSQMTVLQNIKRYDKNEIVDVLQKFPNIILADINEREMEEEDHTLPWEKKKAEKVPADLPKVLEMVLYDRIYIRKNALHTFLKKKLVALTVFHNPEYYQARNMRKSVQDIPMWIQCFEEDDNYLILPVGCLELIEEICATYAIQVKVRDKRFVGQHMEVMFHGDLREKQLKAVEKLLAYDNGILHANTAFGKTVAAIALIAERQINTLIIVDRVNLLEQWCERLSVFLNIPKKEIGVIGGGKKKPSGLLDVAVSQSLYRNNKVSELVKEYGQIICDECHHVSAVGFEQILKTSPAKYKYGLTATLKRKDGKERIVLMQLGPVRYKDLSKVSSTLEHKVFIKNTAILAENLKAEPTINELYDYLYLNGNRNIQIVRDVRKCLDEKRYPIILTERTEHIDIFEKELAQYAKVFKLYGGLKKKERDAVMAELLQLPDNEKRVIIATSRYVGEGFDYPILDTLFLTLPISWNGRVKQYAGRLHRDYHEKKEVRIYDYLDSNIEAARKMYSRRSKGYKNMGYEIIEE